MPTFRYHYSTQTIQPPPSPEALWRIVLYFIRVPLYPKDHVSERRLKEQQERLKEDSVLRHPWVAVITLWLKKCQLCSLLLSTDHRWNTNKLPFLSFMSLFAYYHCSHSLKIHLANKIDQIFFSACLESSFWVASSPNSIGLKKCIGLYLLDVLPLPMKRSNNSCFILLFAVFLP